MSSQYVAMGSQRKCTMSARSIMPIMLTEVVRFALRCAELN